MQSMTMSKAQAARHFPPFDLSRLLRTVFAPQKGEKMCILIDLENPADVINFAFLKKTGLSVQKNAYEVFFQPLRSSVMQQFGLAACDLFAYQRTGGSNLELPQTARSPDGRTLSFEKEIYPVYNIILCITDFSATAPLTATAKRFGFRGSTMHGLNEMILKTGLAVDYQEVSRLTEQLRKGMTQADSVDIDFEIDHQNYSLHIDLQKQEAQKSHGICHKGPDIVNLPAGEVYFVPKDAHGTFPLKLDDGTLALLHVENCQVNDIAFLKGNEKAIEELRAKFKEDPPAAILGELGFGTQVLPHAGRDIQDEKIFGTFHLATGRNDHLNGNVTFDRFVNPRNATHDDILFSPTKTPEIHVKQVRMERHGSRQVLIENYEPTAYLWNLLQAR